MQLTALQKLRRIGSNELDKLADEIEQQMMYRPRYNDGTFVQIGDFVENLGGSEGVVGYTIDNAGDWIIYSEYDELQGDMSMPYIKQNDSWELIEHYLADQIGCMNAANLIQRCKEVAKNEIRS